MLNAAKEKYPNAQAIEWNFKELKIDGVVVDHKEIEIRQTELDVREKTIGVEFNWIKSELIKTSKEIEDKEDQALSAKKLRAYRFKLKQYKTDLYMPNISRPKL